MKTTVLLIAMVCLLISTVRAAQPAEPDPRGLAAPRGAEAAPDPNLPAVGNAINAFSVDLYKHLARREGNLFLSPTSLETALAMVYAGARGDTAEQMADVLHVGRVPEGQLHPAFGQLLETLNPPAAGGRDRPYELTIANALWGQEDYAFNPEYLQLVRRYYGGNLQNVDFVGAPEASRQRINQWVERQTNDRIQDLVPPGAIDALTRLVLTNAIYFKGRWAEPFEERFTRDEAFRFADGSSADVPLMRRSGDYRYAEIDGVQVLSLPYGGEELSMVVVLPRDAQALAALERDLTLEQLQRWARGGRRQEVHVFLPRFRIESQFSLGEALQAMGMTDAFSDDADLSGIARVEQLAISAVLHKAFVDVNEEGTEAAAATAVIVGVTAAPPPSEPAVFRADHPFLFLIRENRSGAILFLGRVSAPWR